MSDGLYGGIFKVYDKLNSDIDYSEWADFYEKLFDKYAGHKVNSILDLACGTGSMTLELAKRGYDMTGVDISPEMLSVARERAADGNIEGILLLCQDMREFELYGTVDAIVCVLDGLNYLSNAKELTEVFRLVNNYLEPEGVFVFDVNTPYKFKNIFADNAYVLEDEGIYCGWQNCYNENKRYCDFYLTLFEETEDGSYLRTDEHQREQSFSERTIKKALDDAGLDFCGMFGGFDMSEPAEDCQRWHFAAKTRKKY